jgi:asparagine synthase (glutamine-hydrolysing)
LRALQRWGDSCLERLRGMFAFAFWDERKRELLLAHDPFGVKPLYYTQLRDRVLFASEPDALFASGLVERAICPTGVSDLLTFLAVPAPRTLFRATHKIEAGTALRLSPVARSRRIVHWDAAWHRACRRDVDPHVALEETRRHRERAVSLALPPAGSFVAAAARSGSRARFVTLDAKRPSPSSEAAAATKTCSRLGIMQEVVAMDEAAFVETFDSLQAARPDIPVPTPDMLLTHLLARRLRRDGIRVCLFGEGADELGSYPSYLAWDRAYPALHSFARLPRVLQLPCWASARLPPEARLPPRSDADA